MKRIFVFTLLLVAINSFSQQSDSIKYAIGEMYTAKSRHQKTAGWVMLGSGLGLMGAGAIIGSNNTGNEQTWGEAFGNAITGGLMFSVGFISSLSNLPLFLASSRNKRRAMTFSTGMKWQPLTVPGAFATVSHSVPELCVRVGF